MFIRFFIYVVCVVVVLLVEVEDLQAQQFREKVQQTITCADTMRLRDMPIIESSLVVTTSGFVLGVDAVLENNALILRSEEWKGKDIDLSYDCVSFKSFSLANVYKSKTVLDSLFEDTVQVAALRTSPNMGARSNTLQKNGVFMRGLSFGNKQSLSAQSNLQLQLKGKLSDRVSIRAAISDYQLPLQSGGRTAKVNELDRIFIELSAKNHTLIAGDYMMRDSTTFLRYTKKRQGLSYSGKFRQDKEWKYAHKSSFALARGTFHRMKFRGIEGQQGPYRLYGKNGELSIIILSGSEKVYINGDLQTRGEQADYTIDYNTAELMFTLTRSIGRNSRISVEYEYTNREYLRYSLGHTSKWYSDKATVYLDYLGEFDDKTSKLNRDLTEEQVTTLEQAGNDPSKAFASTAEEVEYTTDEVVYAQRDTTWAGVPYTGVYVRELNRGVKVYRVRFNFVGEGKGNYRIVQGNENQRVYEWVAPEMGEPKGNYSPVELLQAAERKQMLVAGARAFGDKLKVEVAVSNYDPNTFSAIDNEQNTGVGVNLLFVDSVAMKDSTKQLNYRVAYEYTDHNFTPFDRIREVEFARNWGFEDASNFLSGHLLGGVVDWTTKRHKLVYSPSVLKSDTGDVSAARNDLVWRYNGSKWSVVSESNFAYNTSEASTTSYFKSVNRVQRKFGDWTWGNLLKIRRRKYDGEEHESLQFFDYHSFIAYKKPKRGDVKLQFGQRINFIPTVENDLFLLDARSDEVSLDANLFRKGYTSSFIGNLRHISNVDEESYYRLNMRIKQNWSFWKNRVRTGFFFETVAGQQATREYEYVKVDFGQGEYKWNDYNMNGLQERDEFERAIFADEGNFVKIWLPSQLYEPVQQERFSFSLQFRPKVKSKYSVVQEFGRTTWQVNYIASAKARPTNWWSLGSFLSTELGQLAHTEKVNLKLAWSSKKRTWRSELGYFRSGNGVLLVHGFDNIGLETYRYKLRRRLGDWILSGKTSYSEQENTSDALVGRNFFIRNSQVKVEAIWGGIQRLKITPFLRYVEKDGQEDRLLYIYHSGLITDWKLPKRMQLRLEFDFAVIDYNMQDNSPLSVAMLEGFKINENIFGKVEFNRRFGKFLEVSLFYQARFADQASVTQTGRLQVKAVF